MGEAVHVYGNTVDEATRCVHYRTAVDVVAIRFLCCDRYYPCFQCHAEAEPHPPVRWPESRWGERAILCGVCRFELTIVDYRSVTACPRCGAAFNERCAAHAHLYFETPPVAIA